MTVALEAQVAHPAGSSRVVKVITTARVRACALCSRCSAIECASPRLPSRTERRVPRLQPSSDTVTAQHLLTRLSISLARFYAIPAVKFVNRAIFRVLVIALQAAVASTLETTESIRSKNRLPSIDPSDSGSLTSFVWLLCEVSALADDAYVWAKARKVCSACPQE